MQKAKMGISVGLLGAAIYFMGFLNGTLVAVLLAGYVLLFEENEWLKKTAVKAVTLLVFFGVLISVINLIPNAIGILDDLVGIFGGNISGGPLTYLVAAVVDVIQVIEKLLFLGLGFLALNQGTIAVPVVDKLVDKYM